MQDRHERAGRRVPLVAVAARAGADGAGCGFAGRDLAPALLRDWQAAEREVAIALRVERRQAAQERDQRPDLVVALLRRPGRHAGVLDAVLDDPEQLAVAPRAHLRREIGRRRQHALRDRTDRHARRAVTEGAAAVEMSGAERHEVGVVERRRLDAVGVRLHRVAHREGQEPFHHGPVPAARRDGVEAGPDEQESEQRETGGAEELRAGPGDAQADRRASASSRSVRGARQVFD